MLSHSEVTVKCAPSLPAWENLKGGAAPGGGLGVGEKVLEVLFAGAGGDPAQGVTAMLLLRLTLYAIALPAALVYVLHRRG